MRKVIFALIAILATLLNSLPAAASPTVSCAQTKQWIQENRASLPKTYDELLRYPLAYRPILFDALSSESKGTVVTAHLQRYIDRHPGLTSPQIAVIQEAIDLVQRPEFFLVSHENDALWNLSVGQPLEAFEKEALSVFSRQDFKTIFTQLGSDSETKLPSGIKLQPAAQAPICTCSPQSDWCTGGSFCATGPTSCSQTTGCGTLFTYICTGLCYLH